MTTIATDDEGDEACANRFVGDFAWPMPWIAWPILCEEDEQDAYMAERDFVERGLSKGDREFDFEYRYYAYGCNDEYNPQELDAKTRSRYLRWIQSQLNKTKELYSPFSDKVEEGLERFWNDSFLLEHNVREMHREWVIELKDLSEEDHEFDVGYHYDTYGDDDLYNPHDFVGVTRTRYLRWIESKVTKIEQLYSPFTNKVEEKLREFWNDSFLRQHNVVDMYSEWEAEKMANETNV